MLHLDAEGKVTTKGIGYDIYLSKHMSIPYKADFGDGIVIEIDFLKNLQDKYKKMF